jgi:polyhydroxybutyrate depolymerase
VALFIVAIVAASVVVLNASRSDSSASSPDAVGDRAMGTPGSVDRGSPSDGCKATNGAAPVAPLTLQSTVGTPTRAMRLAAYGDLPSDAGRPLFVDLGDIGETLDQHVAAVPLDSIAIDNAAMIVTLVGQDLPAQWNVERVAGEPDDAGFVLAVIDDLARRYCIDLQRVSVLGYGAGAHMAATIVCAAPERFAALVMLRGAYRPPECGAALGVSVAAILGSADEAYPLPGGTGPEFATLIDAAALRDGALYEVPAPEQAAAAWSLTAKCEDKSQREIGESRVAVLAGCQGKGQVWIAVLSGESHAWSASAGEIVKGFFVNRQRTS